MNLVSKAEYARRRGVTGAAVTIAVKAGRLTLVDGKVDLDTADAEWAGKSRPRVNSLPAVRDEEKGKPERKTADKPRREPDDADLQVPSWQESKAKQAYLDAKMAEIALAKMEGSLIDKAAARAEWAKQTAAVRDGLLSLGARLAAQLAAEADPGRVQSVIDRELRAVLSAFVVDD